MHGFLFFLYFLIMPTMLWWVIMGGRIGDDGRDDMDGGRDFGFSFLTFTDGFFGRSLHCCE
jgi:hypothetical protein